MTQAHYARIADLYDDFVTTQIDVPFFTQEAHKAGGDILELMCGTGRLTLPLARAGIKVTAVDYSAEMLTRLRNKLDAEGLSADVYQMDIRHLHFERQFKQIIIPFQAFPEITTQADQLQALRAIYESLSDDGTFICTLHNPPVRLESVDDTLRLAGRFSHGENQLFLWLHQRFQTQSNVVNVLEFFEEYDSQGMMVSKRFSELQFHMMENLTFEGLIEASGFEAEALYGDYAYTAFDASTSPLMVWVLRKR